MRYTKKQKEQVQEAIDFIENNDVISLHTDPNRVKSDNPYIEHIFFALTVNDNRCGKGVDPYKPQFLKWCLDNMKYGISPLSEITTSRMSTFVTPDPY